MGFTRQHTALLVAIWLALLGLWLPGPTTSPSASAQPSGGRVLAVVGRQVAFLNFDAPRPVMVTAFAAPRFAMDVAGSPGSTLAAISVAQPLDDWGQVGGDIIALDLAQSERPPAPLVSRTDADEWLGAPGWLPDGSAILFQRHDTRTSRSLYTGQVAARQPTRIELMSIADGSRRVLVDDGHHPSSSRDGSEAVFVRYASRGAMLMAIDLRSGEERTLVTPGALSDIAHPRFSPREDRIAFVATDASASGPSSLIAWLRPSVAHAHGLPWNVWEVKPDGSNLRQLSAVSADDASIAWSPGGGQLFVYGSAGSRIVDVSTGEVEILPFLAGYGATTWLP